MKVAMAKLIGEGSQVVARLRVVGEHTGDRLGMFMQLGWDWPAAG